MRKAVRSVSKQGQLLPKGQVTELITVKWLIAMFLVYKHCTNIVIFLLIFKFASHRTIACIVSTANKPLVGTLITIGDVTRNIAIEWVHEKNAFKFAANFL